MNQFLHLCNRVMKPWGIKYPAWKLNLLLHMHNLIHEYLCKENYFL